MIGVLELASKYRYGLTSRGTPMYLFVPYDQEQPDMIVGCTHRDITRNQIAYVTAATAANQNKEKGAKPRGNLVKLYGPVGDTQAEKTALLDHYCPVFGLPKGVSSYVAEPDLTGRQILSAETGWISFHVDPPGCRDIDDVIAWSPSERRWAITIADVDAFVGSNESLLQICRSIGQTFYDLGGRAVRPMLPAAISEEAASLLPDHRIRPGVTLFCNEAWSPERWALTAIRVDKSYTYDTFADALTTATIELPVSANIDTHDWIAQRMICYNTAAAALLKKNSVGMLRCQNVADAAKVDAWRNIHPDLVHLANEAATYIPSLSSAYGHAGLGLDAYCHASSPLRRYADLYNQARLKQIIGSSSPTITDVASVVEGIAELLNERCKAERRWARDLTFLELVPAGKALTIDIIWLPDATRVWVPKWKRLLHLRHDDIVISGSPGKIKIFCDPTKRNWKQRIMTAKI